MDDEDKGVNESFTPRWEAVLGIHQRERHALSLNLPSRHVDDDDKGVDEMATPGGTQKVTVINESGVYSLVLSSKLQQAEVLKRWVTRRICRR